MPSIEFTLRLPPSVNALYRAVNKRVILSKDGRSWYRYAVSAIRKQVPHGVVTEPVTVIYTFFFADKRRRDVFNYEKALSDAITKAGLWDDDQLITDGIVRKRKDPSNPRVDVTLYWEPPV